MQAIKRILIIRLSSLGDVVLTTEFLRLLKKHFPQANIDFIVRKEYADILKYSPHLTKLYLLDTSKGLSGLIELRKELQKANYNVVFDLHNNLRSRLIRFRIASKIHVVRKNCIKRFLLVHFKWNLYKKILSVPEKYFNIAYQYSLQHDDLGLELHIHSSVFENLQKKLRHSCNECFTIAFCPSSKHKTKQWPAERFIDLGEILVKQYNVTILILGDVKDRELCKMIASCINDRLHKVKAYSYAGELTILESAALMSSCSVVVTNDSGLMHIAAALKKKIVAIFGSTVKEFGFYPYKTDFIIVEKKELDCRPCTHIGKQKCPRKHFLCMELITVEEVRNAFDKLLKNL